jgi:phospholipid-binding lipoprotein MlaA
MNIIKICFIGIILTLSGTAASEIDPLKNINERTHVLNQTLDLQLASPIARFYKRVTPDFIEISITNFTSNIEDLSIAINNILQGKPTDGISDITRFTINSTLGIGGFIDVASGLGLDKNDEDFGQTLAVWGIPDGPYLVLPGLGPSTIRDTP